MAHTKREKLKLLNRARRVRGQVEAVERALQEDQGCAAVLHLMVAARGALNSLMTEVIEDHIRLHLVDAGKDTARTRGAEELIRGRPGLFEMNRSEPLMAEATGLSTSPIRGRDGRMQRRKTRYFL